MAGEGCDDGGASWLAYNDGCLACVEQPNWSCTGGSLTTLDTCEPTCGNIVSGNENCDDGNTNDNDGCSSVCVLEPGFSCVFNPTTQRTECGGTCGDSQKMPSEDCDDGGSSNLLWGDGCVNCV